MSSAPLLFALTAPSLVHVHRPASSSWERSPCGSASGVAIEDMPDLPTKFGSSISPTSPILPAYPRPQMVRGTGSPEALRLHGDEAVWSNLNGLWEWEVAPSADATLSPPFGRTLNRSILVPFPIESCLSGVAPLTYGGSHGDYPAHSWYRLTFDADMKTAAGRMLLHFGAVDWQSSVYLDGEWLGNHTGGYDGFSYDVTAQLGAAAAASPHELLVYVFDPSNRGAQPNGKQLISAINFPGGDQYTPSSGIWQTVWLEAVPSSYISHLAIDQASTTAVTLTASCVGECGGTVTFEVFSAGVSVATSSAAAGAPTTIPVPDAKLWRPGAPHLYDLRASLLPSSSAAPSSAPRARSLAGGPAGGPGAGSGAGVGVAPSEAVDSVLAYFGLRTFELGETASGRRPLLNGNFTFLAGFLDQSWWPDGQYTAPTDDGLAFDIEVLSSFGLNMIRLHQKVNPDRWYWHADRLGVVVFQDAVQKYGQASNDTVPLFISDLKAMVAGRRNHPCIVQWTVFNENDCWKVFTTKPYDVAGVVALAKSLDSSRLVDTDSGGGANQLGLGDVNDLHAYPNPADPQPSATQYAMDGEFGGIGAFVQGKEWKAKSCHTYLRVDTPAEEADEYVKMAETIGDRVDHLSASVYTQTTDVELECDGFLNYDRSHKFSDADIAAIRSANQAIIQKKSAMSEQSVSAAWP